MANARATFIGNYMRGRAARGPGAFAKNARLFQEASAAWNRAHGRRNPDGAIERSGARRARSNPGGLGFSGGQLMLIGVGLYALVPAVRAQVNAVARQLSQAGAAATQPTQGA